MEKQKLENHWEVKYQALLDIEEKLRSRTREQEANFQQVEDQLNQMTETKEKMSAELEAVKVFCLFPVQTLKKKMLMYVVSVFSEDQ